MKKSILIALLIINSFSLFAELPEEVQDLEKIRWVFAGIGIPESPDFEFNVLEKLQIGFYLPPATKIYKYVEYTSLDTGRYDDFGKKIIKCGSADSFFEYQNKFFFDLTTGKHPEKYFAELISSKKLPPYSTRSLMEYFGVRALRADGKDVDIRDLSGTYKRDNAIIEVKVLDNKQYVGFAYISNTNDCLPESGIYYLTYDSNKKSFESDALFENNNHPDYLYNDAFQIKILNTDTYGQVLLLEGKNYNIPYIPMENYFSKKGAEIIITTLNSELFDLFESPGKSSKTAVKHTQKNYTYAKIEECAENFEEYNDQISKWVKVKLNSGEVGWVWGGNCTVFEYGNLALDSSVGKRYKYLFVDKRK